MTSLINIVTFSMIVNVVVEILVVVTLDEIDDCDFRLQRGVAGWEV